jgi:hypothetical protein
MLFSFCKTAIHKGKKKAASKTEGDISFQRSYVIFSPSVSIATPRRLRGTP